MGGELTRMRRLTIAAVVLAFAVRAAFGVFYWVGKPLTHDEVEYLVLAHSIAEGRGFTYGGNYEPGTGQKFGRAPGSPMFRAAIGAAPAGAAVPGTVPRQVQIAQSIVGALGVWMIAVI